MAVPVGNLAHTPYSIGAPQILVDVVPLRGEHKIYTTAAARIDDAWAPHQLVPQLTSLTGTINANGDTIYLPYNDDKITSVRLPVPPPAGVNFFMTANMSGCKFFVDTINGSHDLMVYHANTHQHAAPPHNTPANYQDPNAVAVLNAMHTNARADYAPLAFINVATCDKATYYLQAFLEEQRKRNQGRRLNHPGSPLPVDPEFAGGCSVMGFYGGGAWSFYYQTWGGVDYSRKSGAKVVAKDLFTVHWQSLHNLRTKGVSHSYTEDVRVVDHHRIY